jgi:hypothetical protein
MNERARRHLWPELAYNPITALGVVLALFAAAAIVIFYFLGESAASDNPYTGIFTLVVFPGILVLGLVLIPVGMLLEKRRRDRGIFRPFVIDLKNLAHLRALIVFAVGTGIFLLATTVGLYETYHFTESVEFCGATCHVMEPERVAHAASAHARVACVHCHVGPGGDDYVKSKMAGARQLWHFARGDYHRPIETPVYTLRPARETCEECHWSTHTHQPTVVVRDHYLSDRSNRRWRIELLFNTGSGDSVSPITGGPVSPTADGSIAPTTVALDGSAGGGGIHWHVAEGNTVTYVASDSSRQSFDQVAWSRADGTTVTYRREGVALTPEELRGKEAKGLTRTMDCLDCHNRPAHRYLSPIESVNRALTAGTLDRSIPWIKRESVRALTGTWASHAESDTAIAGRLGRFYAREGIALPAGTIEAVQQLARQQSFPAMEVSWKVYPENHGHLEFAGCFRCHGAPLASDDGRRIRADCNLCHVLLSQNFVDEPPTGRVRNEPFRHPIDVLGAETALNCTDCHGGDATLYRADR